MARGPRKLAVMFGSTSLTHYGGVYLLHRFFGRLHLKKLLTDETRLIQRNNRYSVGEMLLALLYPIILGLERIESTRLLRQNGVFQYLTGLRSYPDATTLRRFLLRVTPTALPKLRRLHDRFRFRLTTRPHSPRRLIFDVDSTVLVVYGKQEPARIGYNPIKRGRPSYHPLLCFEGQTKDCWHGELRPGDAHTASGTLDLLTACFAKRPAGVRLTILRADKGFYDHQLVEWLEARRARFVIVARLTAPIKRKLSHLRYASPSARGAIPTRHFFANETYFHLLLLAYNLINWFKRLCLPPEFQNAPLQTLRHQILFMPAQLRRTDNRPRWVLPSSGLREAAWEYALDQIERLEL